MFQIIPGLCMLYPLTYRYHIGYFSPYVSMIASISLEAVLTRHLFVFATQRLLPVNLQHPPVRSNLAGRTSSENRDTVQRRCILSICNLSLDKQTTDQKNPSSGPTIEFKEVQGSASCLSSIS